MSLETALTLARDGRKNTEQELLEELRIPSVSTLPEHRADVRRNCEWLASRFRSLGFSVSITDVLEGGHPVLQADWRVAGESAPTLTIYGHYDVQPPDPLEEWSSPPFEPRLQDGLVFARGSTDNKGNHLASLKAAEYALAAGGPPVNLRFLIEGEEEISGRSLPQYLRANASRLATDWVLVWDGGFSPEDKPCLVTGLRGLLYVELHASGAPSDLHSGSFGGVAPNPLNTLARILGELKDRKARVTIPGFYDRVRRPEPSETADWDFTAGFDQTVRDLTGATALEGEEGVPAVERAWARPTLDVNGFIGGFTGEGEKTVIAARGSAKVSMRLVPDQDGEEILASLRSHVQRLTTPGVKVEVELRGMAPPVLAGADHPGARALAAAFEAAFGQRTVRVRTGGSIPVSVDFQQALGAPLMISGLSQPGGGAHGPNEHLSLDHFHRGTEALVRLFWELCP
ncbi:MAG: M20/M25/M40 family metallo-hydrolase [Candidatus Dormibacteraeota bacterium]|nr:M20/M25/M40 family metallo-hydrolase [Candidatus Dormibacteraeota bacterium]